jgi:hypothetical protein
LAEGVGEYIWNVEGICEKGTEGNACREIQDIVQLTKHDGVQKRRMRWAKYVARMGQKKRIQSFGGEISKNERLDQIGLD